MRDSEEPKAGQWWLTDDGKPMLIAFDERTIGSESTCPIIAYRKPDCGEWYAVKRFVRRLPDDAGFDWKPETWPKYYMPSSQATCAVFHRRDSEKKTVGVERNGKEWKWAYDWTSQEDAIFVEITKAEAEARIVKPAPIPEIVVDPKTFTSDCGPFSVFSPESLTVSPEPDPEEWVTQDRVPDRTGIDQWRWVSNKNGTPCRWYDSRQNVSYMHGHQDEDELFEVRCRRKDLPPLPKAESRPKLIPVRLYWYDGNVVARYNHSPPTDPSFVEIKLDPELHISDSGFYVEGTGT